MTTSTVERRTLYSTELHPRSDTSLAEQVCEALKREIFLERWAIGERLPSQSDLAKLAGVSVRPIREAMELLDREGFVSRIEQKGTFLKSTSPEGDGRCGCVTLVGHTHTLDQDVTHAATDTFGIWNTMTLSEHAAEIKLETEIVNLVKGRMTYTPRASSAGTISLVTPDELAMACPDLAAGPVVYLGVADPLCSPRVNGNPARAMEMLTEYLLQQGHRDIVLFAPAEWNEAQLAGAINGHAHAMRRAGQTPNEDAIQVSREIRHLSVGAVKDFLTHFSSATAVISMSIFITQKLGETADVLDIAIPDDLEIVSLQHSDFRPGCHDARAGIAYPWQDIVKTCYSILLEQQRYTGVSSLEFEPYLMLPSDR